MSASSRIALYPGSFDALTYGHLDLIQRGRVLFDRLYVAVAQNSRKQPWFQVEERLELIRQCTADWTNVEAVRIEGLTIDMADRLGARFIIRGLRAVSDFEFEFQLAIMNHELNPNVETIFLAPSPRYVFLSSSMVREIWELGGDVSSFVPPPVLEAFERKRREAHAG